jgi:hypothetical protein
MKQLGTRARWRNNVYIQKIISVLMILFSLTILAVGPIGYSDFVPSVNETLVLIGITLLGLYTSW